MGLGEAVVSEHVAESRLDLSLQIGSHSSSLDSVTCRGGESSCSRNYPLHGSNSRVLTGVGVLWPPQVFLYQRLSQPAHGDDSCKGGPLEAKILHYRQYSLSAHPAVAAGVGLVKAHRNLCTEEL